MGLRLREEQRKIERIEKELAGDGKVSARDRRIVSRMQDEADARIVTKETCSWHRLRFLPRLGR
jgi:hypothetical protein